MKQYTPSVINIMHYHLHTGGVTSVITKTVQALLEAKQFSYIKKIVLFTGSRKNMLKIRKHFNTTKVEVRFKKELGYIEWLQKDKENNTASTETEHTTASNTALFKSKKETIEKLLQFFISHNNEETLWWVHNYHLGKNPLFTLALLQFIKKYDPYMLLQIHDFPEQTRFSALERLIHVPGENILYNFNDHTTVAVINEHDKHILQKASIDAQLLPNIVTYNTSTQHTNTTDDSNSLKKYITHKKDFAPQYNEGNYLLFTYPVRCIRRKNVLEAMLITKMFEARFAIPCVVNITLPGESEQERPYSTIIERLIHTGKVPGIFSLGTQKKCPFSFQEICSYSDAIISSSVLEGFGFSYLDSVLYNSPLVARSIAQTKQFEYIFSLYWPSTWYKSITIPQHIIQSLPSIISDNVLHFSYKTKIDMLPDIVDEATKESLIASIDSILKKNTIDFSFLSTAIQEYLLKNFDTFRRDITYANIKLLQKIYDTLVLFAPSRNIIEKYRSNATVSSRNKRNTALDYSRNNKHKNNPSLRKIALQVISKHYGTQAFLQSFETILKHINSPKKHKNKKPYAIFYKILHQHLTIENLRLLYNDI